jgi:lysophospholipase L1-like esterase
MGLPRRSVVLAVVLAVPAVFWLFRAGSPRAARPTAGQTIVAFDDSLVEGRGTTPGHDFVSVLSRRLIARRTSSGLVPDILHGIIGHADRMSDAIHPNDQGHEMIADRLEPTLRDLMRAD